MEILMSNEFVIKDAGLVIRLREDGSPVLGATASTFGDEEEYRLLLEFSEKVLTDGADSDVGIEFQVSIIESIEWEIESYIESDGKISSNKKIKFDALKTELENAIRLIEKIEYKDHLK
jgi:hypothetical protein